MEDQDWIELSWELFCPRAARFWRHGLRPLGEECLERDLQWYEDEEEETEGEMDRAEGWIVPEEDRGDPVFRVLQSLPFFVWVGALFCFLRFVKIEMGLLKAGSKVFVVQCRPSNRTEKMEKDVSDRSAAGRCLKCPFAFLCSE
jgi:hypothetical protein